MELKTNVNKLQNPEHQKNKKKREKMINLLAFDKSISNKL